MKPVDHQQSGHGEKTALDYLERIDTTTRGSAVLDALADMIERAGLSVGDRLPPEVTLAWVDAPVDGRGVVNLTPLVGPEARPGVVFAKTEVRATTAGPRRAWVTYTDNLSLWCNGRLIFEGPPRQWFHPDREKNGNSRLIPDQYEVALPLLKGVNEILVRSEVTEAAFGWGFWLRVD